MNYSKSHLKPINNKTLNIKIIDINSIDDTDINLIKNKTPHKYFEIQNINDDLIKKYKYASLIHIIKNFHCREDDIVYNDYGKPKVIGSDREFSISNNGDLSVYVEDDNPIGIDILLIKDNYNNTITSLFSKAENLYIENDKLNNIPIIWTRKEAFYKMLGTGIINRPNELDVEFTDGHRLFDEISYKNEQYCISTVKYGNYYISVAGKNRININIT